MKIVTELLTWGFTIFGAVLILELAIGSEVTKLWKWLSGHQDRERERGSLHPPL